MKSVNPLLFAICAIVALLWMSSCRYDALPPLGKTCPNSLPIISNGPCDHTIANTPEPPLGFVGIGPDRGFVYPTFNPHDRCEILVVKGNGETKIADLIIYDVETNTERFIMNIKPWSYPRWSVKDWIVFQASDGQIWKVKSEGDSLTRLTHFGGNYDPDWSPDGEKIVYERAGKGLAIMDAQGNLLMELDSIKTSANWSPDGDLLAFVKDKSLAFYHISTGEVSIITPFPEYYGDSDKWIRTEAFAWLPDGQKLIWGNHDSSFFITDILTEETTQIIEGCGVGGDRSYSELDVSHDGKKLVASRTSQKLVSPDTIEGETVMALLNIDGSEEVIIRPVQ
jgi:WD40 repeat protein